MSLVGFVLVYTQRMIILNVLSIYFFFFFFFFKQKTAYEIYQCDWSSDVCSSDLASQYVDKQPLGRLEIDDTDRHVIEPFENRHQ